jgi:hypothetical protein
MGVLGAEKPTLRARDGVAILETAVDRFYDEHAQTHVTATRHGNPALARRPQPFGRCGLITRTL